MEEFEDFFDKVCQWIPSHTSWDPFFSSVVLRLLEKYPKMWILEIKREGHVRTGFVEDKCWTFTAINYQISIQQEHGKHYPYVTLSKASKDEDIKWVNYCSLQSSGTIARELRQIADKLSDQSFIQGIAKNPLLSEFKRFEFVPNSEFKKFDFVPNSENPYQVYSDLILKDSEFVPNSEFFGTIIEKLGWTPNFLANLVDRLLLNYEILWEVKIEKFGHPRTGYVEDVIYSLTLNPYTIIIEGNSIKILKEKTIIFEHNYLKLDYFITTRLNVLKELQQFIPKPISIQNNEENIYLIYRQYDQYANREGFNGCWKYQDSFIDKNKAYHSALNSLISYARVLLIRAPLNRVMNIFHRNNVIDGDRLLLIETRFVGDYYKIEINSEGQVVKTLQNQKEHNEELLVFK